MNETCVRERAAIPKTELYEEFVENDLSEILTMRFVFREVFEGRFVYVRRTMMMKCRICRKILSFNSSNMCHESFKSFESS